MTIVAENIIDEAHIKCPSCGKIAKIQNRSCRVCLFDFGPPNVNIANTPEENTNLQKRYEEAIRFCEKNGYKRNVDEFEKEMLRNANLSINIKYDVLRSWVLDTGFACKTYYNLIREEQRDYMDLEDDQKRSSTDSKLYNHFISENLVFAALTLDKLGVINYGNCTVVLEPSLVENRTSLIEENSWKFAERHKLQTIGAIPKGYRCVWKKRHQLAVAKHFKELHNATSGAEFSLILLKQGSKGLRMEDDYVEGHIYGELSFENIAYVKGNTEQLKNESYIGLTEEYRKRYADNAWARIIDTLKDKWEEWNP